MGYLHSIGNAITVTESLDTSLVYLSYHWPFCELHHQLEPWVLQPLHCQLAIVACLGWIVDGLGAHSTLRYLPATKGSQWSDVGNTETAHLVCTIGGIEHSVTHARGSNIHIP